jgi:hypothetical protein
MDNPHNYVEADVAKTINRNPDWICSYCDALNSDDLDHCHICNASREDSEQNYFERQAELEARRANKATQQSTPNDDSDKLHLCESSSSPSDKPIKQSQQTNNSRMAHKTKRVPWGGILKVGAGVLAAVLFIMCMLWIFTPKIQDVTIQDFSWERSIDIEEYRTVEESNWYLPSGARLKYSQQEIQGYEQILDHYETKTREYTEQVIDHYETYVSGYRDLGNGYFEEIESQRPVYRTETRTETYQEPVYRDEPIYATKYYYEIDVWRYAFSYKSSGNDKDPYWEEFELKDLQREGGRNETYYISVINEDNEVSKYRFDFETWNRLEIGEKVTIKTTIFGGAELVVDGNVVSESVPTR